MKTISAFFSASMISLLRPASLLACAAVLSGCASTGVHSFLHPDDAHHVSDVAQAAISAEKDLNGEQTPVVATDENLPTVSLSEELLYKILTAEIAYQRGNWQAAYVTLLGAAQQTRDPRLARRSVEIALSAKQAGEALTAIRLWRELAPKSNEATQYYLGFMVMNNNLAEIQNVFTERFRTADPKQHAIIMLQAQRLLSRARDKNAAFDVLEEILSPYKNSPDAHLALAQGAYTKGDNKRAVKEAEAALSARPDSQLAILTIAQASPQADAAKALANFLNKNPTARDVRLAYASILIDLKQLDKASHEFEQLLRDKPDDISTLYTLGVLAMEKNQPAQAERYLLQYLKALEARPGDERDPTPALMHLSRLTAERKDYKAAQEWLSKIESFDGRNPVWFNAQMRRAGLLSKEGKLDEALSLLKSVKGTNDNEQIQIIQTEAQLLKDAGKNTEASNALRAGTQQYPNNPDLLYDYAMLLESSQNMTEMEAALRQVIALAPESQHAYNALGYSLADRNSRLDEALTLIEKANQLAPDDPFILDSLGWVKFRLSKLDEAETILRRAYQLRSDVEIANHLGEVLWVKGAQSEARKIWREAVSKEPGNQALKSTLQRLKIRL
ncbi:tetratricopeptide repeat protein [Undibacterium sp. SXout7W]|uniref:tetratricopeptide repeat protein n=1 Tax=Undibacterium sp. SXout7W TaxID=3413049 RepID=UPI003BF0C753